MLLISPTALPSGMSTSDTPDLAPATPAELLTTAEVAQRLTSSRRAVQCLISLGLLPAVRLGSGRASFRVAEPDLAAFLAAYRTIRD